MKHTYVTLNNFLQIPLNISFYLFCNPFLILVNRSGNEVSFKNRRFWPHSILVGILCVANLLWVIAVVRNSLPTVETSNPVVFINLIYILLTYGGQATFLLKLWFPGDKLVNFANVLCSTDMIDLVQFHPRWAFSKHLVFAMTIIFSGFGVWDATITADVDNFTPPPGYAAQWWSRLVRAGRKVLFLNQISQWNNQNEVENSGVDIISGIVAFAGSTHV